MLSRHTLRLVAPSTVFDGVDMRLSISAYMLVEAFTIVLASPIEKVALHAPPPPDMPRMTKAMHKLVYHHHDESDHA